MKPKNELLILMAVCLLLATSCAGGKVITDPNPAETPVCESDADCDENQVCQNGVCADIIPDEPPPEPECESDADCDTDQICEEGACVSPTPEAIPEPEVTSVDTAREGEIIECPFSVDQTAYCDCPVEYSWDGEKCLGDFSGQDLTWSTELTINTVDGIGRRDRVTINSEYSSEWRSFIVNSTMSCILGSDGDSFYDVISNACTPISDLDEACIEKLMSVGYCAHLLNWPDDDGERWWIGPSPICGSSALFNGRYRWGDDSKLIGNCIPCAYMGSVPAPFEIPEGCQQ